MVQGIVVSRVMCTFPVLSFDDRRDLVVIARASRVHSLPDLRPGPVICLEAIERLNRF